LPNNNDIGLLLSFAKRNQLIRAGSEVSHEGLTCPFRSSPMTAVNLTHRLGVMQVDVCSPCVALWTDPGEITKLSQSTIGSTTSQELPAMDPDLPLSWQRRSMGGDADGTVTTGPLNLLVEIFTSRI
jgi:Zn-finger nucleic acid-binding protein